MIKCSLGLQLNVWIMQVSILSSVHINRFPCMRQALIDVTSIPKWLGSKITTYHFSSIKA